jgi:CBS domain-containing protein
LHLHLAKTPVDELVPEAPRPAGESGKSYWRGIITVSNDDSVRAAFEKLVKNGILSAPVRSGVHGSDQNTYHGFVDMLDLVDFVVRSLHIGDDSDLHTVTDVQNRLTELQETLNAASVSDLLVCPSHRASLSCFPVPDGITLFSVFDMLASSGSFRIPILNSFKKIVNVITLSMMLRYIYEHVDLIPDATRNKPVKEFVESQEVHVIRDDTRAIFACQMMSEKRLNGVAVVNQEGEIVETFSVKDLRGIGLDAHQIWRLFMPTGAYKKKQTELFPSSPNVLATVTLNDTFETVLGLFVAHKLHNVWVVDDHKRPTHEITPTRIIQLAFGDRPSE